MPERDQEEQQLMTRSRTMTGSLEAPGRSYACRWCQTRHVRFSEQTMPTPL